MKNFRFTKAVLLGGMYVHPVGKERSQSLKHYTIRFGWMLNSVGPERDVVGKRDGTRKQKECAGRKKKIKGIKKVGSGRRKVLSRAGNIGHLYLCDSVVHAGSYRVLTPRV